MSERGVLLLVNPTSGGKPGGIGLEAEPAELEPEALAHRLERAGLRVALRVLGEDDDPGRLAGEAAARGDDVVVSGGDGTVHAAAAALVSSGASLGIFATGSFNNIARGLRVPLELDAAVTAIARGEGGAVDVGLARHRDVDDPYLFFEGAGVGLDAVAFRAGEIAERRGALAGLAAGWQLLRWRSHRLTLSVDDDGEPTEYRALLVVVSNGPYYGLGFSVSEQADPTDGRLAVSIFSGMSRWEVVRHFLAIARGRHRYEPRIETLAARRVRIDPVRVPLPVHADGHALGRTPVVFEVLPGALRVFGAGSTPEPAEGA